MGADYSVRMWNEYAVNSTGFVIAFQGRALWIRESAHAWKIWERSNTATSHLDPTWVPRSIMVRVLFTENA